MTAILKLLGLIGGIVPIILTLITAFETPGFGAQKKKVADGNVMPITKEKLSGIASGFIDIAVAFFNLVGWFKHGNPIVSS